jgi:hypothetical protein
MPFPPLLLSRPTNFDSSDFLPISIRSRSVLTIELHPVARLNRSLDFFNARQFHEAVVLVARGVSADFLTGLVVDAWAREEELGDGFDRGFGDGGCGEERCDGVLVVFELSGVSETVFLGIGEVVKERRFEGQDLGLKMDF